MSLFIMAKSQRWCIRYACGIKYIVVKCQHCQHVRAIYERNACLIVINYDSK